MGLSEYNVYYFRLEARFQQNIGFTFERAVCTILPISVGQISRNLNTTRRSMLRFLSEQNFGNLPVTGRFSTKTYKIDFFFNVVRLSRHNSAMIIDRWIFITK